MTFVGDTFLSSREPLFGDSLQALFTKSDLVSCNFEGAISKNENLATTKIGPSLLQNKKSPKFLLERNFNLFNLANNHIMDYGSENLSVTMKNLPSGSYLGAGLDYSGAYKPLFKDFQGVKVGFLSFAEWDFGCFDEEALEGYAWINHPDVNNMILGTKRKVDFLVVQIHAGLENVDIPFPQWRSRYKELVDNGADLIIGHHPHVPQGWEKYKGRYIFYSLGNFFMDYRASKEYDKGVVLQIELKDDLTIDFSIIPIEKRGNTVELLQDPEYLEYLNNLNQRLISDDYYYEVDKIAKNLWDTVYRDYYYSATNKLSFSRGVKTNLYCLLKRLKGESVNELFLLHNLRKESHRYVVERYLRTRLDEISKK